jgi:peptide/bleomycin uptake transporter
VELQSVHKRLRAFEATLSGEKLPEIDRRYMETGGVEDDLSP